MNLSILSSQMEISEWIREVEKAQKKKRKPRLRNAMFRVYAPNYILDGFLVLLFILLRWVIRQMSFNWFTTLRNWEDRKRLNWFIRFNQIVAAAGVGAIANSIPEANCFGARTRVKRQSHDHWRHIVATEQRHKCTSQYSRHRRNIHEWRER